MKNLSFIAAAALIATAVASCDNSQVVQTGEETYGEVKVTFEFASSVSGKADPNDYNVPTTTWSDIQSLAIVVVGSDNYIKAAKDVTDQIANATGTAAQEVTISNVATGSGYTVYMLANYKTTDTQANGYGYAGIPGQSFDVASYVGSLYTTLPLSLSSGQNLDSRVEFESEHTFYDAAPNYFVGSTSDITVSDGETTSVSLSIARIEALVRVRIDNTVEAENAKVTPTYVLLRRLVTSYTFPATWGSNSEFATYMGEFSTTEPTTSTGYTGNSTILATPYSCFSDALIWPTGSTTESSEQINVVVVGFTNTSDYTPSGSTSTVEQGTLVYWQGNIKAEMPANNIVVANVQLANKGELGPIEDPGTYGNIEVTVSLLDWEELVEVDMSL